MKINLKQLPDAACKVIGHSILQRLSVLAGIYLAGVIVMTVKSVMTKKEK